MKLSIWLAGAGAVLLAGAAHASTSNAPPPARPGSSLAPLAPAAAEGRVVLRCKVTPERALDECAVASEAPAGHGLGEAALRMAKDVRIQSEVFKPEMVGRTIDIPMRFAQDAPAQTLAASGDRLKPGAASARGKP